MRVFSGKQKNGSKHTQELEEELQKEKTKKQKLAVKRFAKERFFQQRPDRKKTEDLIEHDNEDVKIITKRDRYLSLKREFQQYDLQQILNHEGIDFSNPELNIKWLPLHYFDDATQETIFVDDIINFDEVFTDEQAQHIQATCHALYRVSEQTDYEWLTATVQGYSEKEQKFKVLFENNQIKQIPRLYICFDIEDPERFAKRLANAFQRRLYADSLIRYKFYIQAMPIEHLSELSFDTKLNIDSLVKNKRLQFEDTEQLMNEIAQEYAFTLNSIIFEKYLNEQSSDMVPHSLAMPPKKELQTTKYYGLLPINKGPEIYMYSPSEIFKTAAKEFTEIFKEFCLQSFLITPEAIKVLHETLSENEKLNEIEFFNLNVPKQPYKLEDFQTEMENQINTSVQKLKTNWIPNIQNSIKSHFESSEKGWLSLKLKDISAYDSGKLKRFFILIQSSMQDSLLSLCQKSFKNYSDFITYFIPESVDIKSSKVVITKYKNGTVTDSSKPDTLFQITAIKPLFYVDVLKNTEDGSFSYSKIPGTIVTIIQMIFDKLIDDVNKLPNVEKSLLHEMFRANEQSLFNQYLRAPKRRKFEEDFPVTKSSTWEWDENAWIEQIFDNLTAQAQAGVKPLEDYLKTFDQYQQTLKLEPEEYAKQFDSEEQDKQKDVEAIREEIKKNQKLEKQLKDTIPEEIQISIFQVRLKDIVQHLTSKYNRIVSLLIEIIAKRAKTQTDDLLTEINKIKDKIKEAPPNIEKLTEITEYMQVVPLDCEKIKKQIESSMEIYKIAEEFQKKFTEEDIKKKWKVYGGPRKVLELVDSVKEKLESEKLKFRGIMERKQEKFKQKIEDVEKTIQAFSQYSNMNENAKVAADAEGVNAKLQKYIDKARKFNNQENLFNREITDYSKIQQLVKEFTPYSNLWIWSRNWFQNKQIWFHGKFIELEADKCEKFVDEAVRIFNQTTRYFRDRNITAVNKIAIEVQKEILEFRPKVPLMVALRKQGMRDRHWDQISKVAGFDVYPNEDYTFTKVLDMGLMNTINQCSEIGDKAFKEYLIENDLIAMKKQWEEINLELKQYVKGSTNTFIIINYEDINNLLDEHMLKTQAMQFSPFKKPFEDEINAWNESLKLMIDILEEWAKYQSNWMYLQPIFDSPDISKQLPGEYKKFKTVDQNWKQTMNLTNNVKNCLKVTSTEGLLQKLKEGNENLDIIQRELNNYLERKRERFARFYFLANDELLEILSRTKDPTAVQPYLKKVFENVHKLDIAADKKFFAMYSGENERIKFVKVVDPINKNVEDWMGEVEDQMKQSVRYSLDHAVKDYPRLGSKSKNTRIDWIKSHPGQAILNGSQVHWTIEVEDAIKLNKVKDYWEQTLGVQLNDLVEAVRLPMTKQQKITLNALIVIDVHAKDVVEKLWQNDVNEIGAFEWISQLRYYWYINKEENQHEENCWVQMVQTNFPYGYEYLGNTLRLVITPLTDKCYMTLMGALKLNLGGAPAGPAGTGKTESTKDLAKALAKQCVVFNCSDQMDYLMLGKFFKGLASSGAWCCFDEFNRIGVEVLSVIAQQLQILFNAKKEKKDRVENFEGSDIRLLPTFSVFITMNPGYAGRTELPDNLKALFRGVAMMVPDYAMIGEIMLYSFGFKKGRELAKKMVVTFKLSSEQLSSQDHYDYGMRAVRSVINAAGLLKGQDPDMEEDLLLLRALLDVNVPKFLKDDIPLFENIIKDLFPGIEKPKIDYGKLLQSIKSNCLKLKLQQVEVFINKVIQLYDTIQVRHGLMIVGPSGGGKTRNYQVLKGALSDLETEGYYKVQTWIMNPKSITMGQLYGAYNETTREWHDGILALTVRQAANDQSGVCHWVVFDGPVDSLWIESMNTVLDDNKKLCLNSGEILTLSKFMTMIFEVEDLLVASPATVSRCGMVYMEPESMGIEPLIKSWIQQIPENCFTKSKTFVSVLENLFVQYVDPIITFMRKYLQETVQTSNNNILQSLQRILDCFFKTYVDTELKKITEEEIKNLESQLDCIFIYAAIWSLCCTVEYASREKMNEFCKALMVKNGLKVLLPEAKTMYDYQWDVTKKEWVLWSEHYKNYEVDLKLSYNEIMVPTNDSTRNMYNMKLLLSNLFHVICPGPTGTGKSLNIYNLLQNNMGEDYQYIALTFSAQTSANQTQDTIDSKLEKRRRGIFGPPVGKKCIIFVDDLNMPKKEYYGAQPPLELLRQYMDHKGWFNRKDHNFMKIEDIVMLSAMGPPGGGRTAITPRLLRHFNVISYTDLDKETIQNIFITLLDSFFQRFNEEIKGIIIPLVESVLHIYYTVKEDLLPTPRKSHYTFNLRDISKVFQGVCNASQKYCNDKPLIVRVWYHENMRIFHDRLIDEEDREYLKKLLESQFTKFSITTADVLNIERILFGDFQQGREVEPRHYYQIPDLKVLINQMNDFQEEYNADPTFAGVSGKNSMKLVLFLDACEHICRITRILRQPSGHALLLGVGGSGRQSLSKMGTFIAGYSLFQIEVIKGYSMRSWREDIKKVLMQAGVEKKETTFLFVDTQIINEQQVEDINNILNSGDVTGIYIEKDMEDIVMACKQDCLKKNLQPNKMNIFAQYLLRVRANIHLVIAMSPLSTQFQNRLRMFPSLVNCCTLDWFTEWPEEALLGVGKGQLQEFAEANNIEEAQLEKLVECFKTMHKSVEKISIQYKNELRRINYVTPTSYLELLTMFKQVMKEKYQELLNSIDRLKKGLDRLIGANIEVERMQVQLKDLQPQLEQAAIDTQKYMVQLEIDKKEADETQKIVAEEEAIATQEAEKANEIKLKAEASVSDANKILDAAVLEVKKLKKDHIIEVKSLKNPPPASLDILGAMCYLLQDELKKKGQIGIKMKNVEGSLGKKTEDFYSTSAILLNEPQILLDTLINYDKENINQQFIYQLEQKILPSPNFNLEKASNCSLAIKYIFVWARAMYDFNRVFLQTAPLRNQLMQAEKFVKEKMAYLAEKKAVLAKVEAKVRQLEEDFRITLAKKEELEKQMELCKVKLERALKLTSGLSDEKVRWSNDIQLLQSKEDLIAGNSVIGAGMVAYSGPFTSNYRKILENSWVNRLDEIGIKHEDNITMFKFLGVPVVIQQWNICGLPQDDTSIENGIIIDKSRRWSLMIDPQTQANKYIKNMGKDSHEEGIDVVKMSDNNLMRTLEIALQHGKWVLVENVGKELDPSLDPILLQQVVKSSSGKSIQIGDKTLNYNDSFKFFMTTTNPNPYYSPETFVKVCIINFAITKQGLEDQMLAQIVALENPQLEQKKTEIVKKNAQDKRDLLNIEDQILRSLQQCEDIEELLKDETLINTLQNAKRFASEINQRMKDSKITEQEIDKAREGFRPVAYRASILFFCIVDLNRIDPMYEYSLQWFINLFKLGVEVSPPAKELEQRLKNLNDYFTFSLYENICRSLFERHKLLFSFMLTVNILQGDNKMNDEEWRYLLAGPSGDIEIPENPTTYIPNNQWGDMFRQLNGLSQLECLQGFSAEFIKNSETWKSYYDSQDPHVFNMPGKWQNQLTEFQKIIVLKSIRPDKVVPAVANWIIHQVGEQFIIPPIFDLSKCYRDSTVLTPLIFVLSSGSDPISDFNKFAVEMEMNRRADSISLGQGQGIKAERMIKEYIGKGGWVLLQNCHLAESWMPDLEKIVEEFNVDSMHPDFRLWLTSMPSEKFPISVLQNGVKMTLEPPQGLRQNLKRSYVSFLSDEYLNSCKKPEQFKKLVFGFCFFHAVIQDRRKFGPIGWNIAYEFTMEDLMVTLQQLKMQLDEYDKISWKVLNFLGAEINYGGRVTDDKDKTLISNILSLYMQPQMLEDGYKMSSSGIYYSPPAGDQNDYINYIDTLPLDPSPEVFGLHDNAEITNAQNQTLTMLETILSVQPRTSSGGGKTREEIIDQIATFIQSKTPKVFDYDDIFIQYPTDYNESMNSVLSQEVIRYNRLLSVMQESLTNVKKALKGLVVMSEELEGLANQLFDNQVPALWASKGFLSLKPLASWTVDLNDRVYFLQKWIDNGTPNVFWISGLFFPQAFITGTLQNHARKHFIAVDRLNFEFLIQDQITHEDIKQKPDDGCYIYGMFLEGARWNENTHIMDESKPKELFSNLPMILLNPIPDRLTPLTGVYLCPLYKVVSRRGTLSTTGHSTNFVMFIELNTDKASSMWIVAGVAAFLALRY